VISLLGGISRSEIQFLLDKLMIYQLITNKPYKLGITFVYKDS